MPQHATDACGEGNELWLPLTEYSVKSGVSLSTIRRKIKSNSIPFRLEKGRYLILFNSGPLMSHPVESPVVPVAPVTPPTTRVATPDVKSLTSTPSHRENKDSEDRWSVPIVERAVQMVRDTFEQLLKEKDERIRLLEHRSRELEDRLNELKLLVRVLEEKYEVRY